MKLHWFGKKTTNELSFNERKELRKAYFRQAREICGSIDYNGFYSIDDEKGFPLWRIRGWRNEKIK